MKPIDLFVLIPVIWGVYKGYTKGFIIEFTTLISLVIAIFLGFQLTETVIGYLQDWIDVPDGMMPYIAFVLVFIAVLFLISWVAKGIKKVVNFTLLGQLDNIAGAVFGGLKFAFILSVLLWLTDQTAFIIPSSFTDDAVVYPILVEYSPLLISKLTDLFPFTKDLVYSINKLITY